MINCYTRGTYMAEVAGLMAVQQMGREKVRSDEELASDLFTAVLAVALEKRGMAPWIKGPVAERGGNVQMDAGKRPFEMGPPSPKRTYAEG